MLIDNDNSICCAANKIQYKMRLSQRIGLSYPPLPFYSQLFIGVINFLRQELLESPVKTKRLLHIFPGSFFLEVSNDLSNCACNFRHCLQRYRRALNHLRARRNTPIDVHSKLTKIDLVSSPTLLTYRQLIVNISIKFSSTFLPVFISRDDNSMKIYQMQKLSHCIYIESIPNLP